MATRISERSTIHTLLRDYSVIPVIRSVFEVVNSLYHLHESLSNLLGVTIGPKKGT